MYVVVENNFTRVQSSKIVTHVWKKEEPGDKANPAIRYQSTASGASQDYGEYQSDQQVDLTL